MWNPAIGNSGSDGILESTYTAPEVSGVVNIAVNGVTNGQPTSQFSSTIAIMIAGLQDLGSGANYNLVGQTTSHTSNHFGTSGFNSTLVQVANRYAAAFSGSKLNYNDMSLVWGGLFDIGAGWATPHKSHRFGQDIDIGLVPATQRAKLQSIIKAAGIKTILQEGNHWHLRQ